MSAFDFRTYCIWVIIKGQLTITMLTYMLEKHLQLGTAMRAIEIYSNRIQWQRNTPVTFATWSFNIKFFTHLATGLRGRGFLRNHPVLAIGFFPLRRP
jgi:hypothetical protein